MKKFITLTMLLFTSLSMFAQNLKQQTTIEIILKVRKEQVVMGPYARYAKQYLGVTVPLNNKTIYSIVDASIQETIPNQNKKSDVLVCENKIVNSASQRIDFIDVSINPITTGISTRSDAEIARSAAETIFTLRKRRFEMVTGESIDLGAGTEAAIKEMARIEREYLNLFTGITSTEYISYVFEVIPSTSRDKYIVCRISENGGILNETDLTGEPVLLVIKSLNTLPEAPARSKKDATTKVLQPEIVECTLFIGTDKMLSENIYMYQFGKLL